MNPAYAQIVRHAFNNRDKMPRTKGGKNPLVAFLLGFCFGPFGVGLYLRSWADFFVLLLLVFGGTVLTVGVAAPVLWVLCGVWGAVRASDSKGKSSDDLPPGSAVGGDDGDLFEPVKRSSSRGRLSRQHA